jgi:hypothetical protein
VLVPVPVEVLPPGDRVNVHVPDDGRPLNITLPVATLHVGCVIVPTVGATGGVGTALITTFNDDPETQPAALVTVKVYVPEAGNKVIVVLVPVPVVVVPPGDLVSVHVPDEGKLLNITLPVVILHVG